MSIDPRAAAFPWPSIQVASQMLVERIAKAQATNHSVRVA